MSTNDENKTTSDGTAVTDTETTTATTAEPIVSAEPVVVNETTMNELIDKQETVTAEETTAETTPLENAETQDTSVCKSRTINKDEVKPGMTIRVHERIMDVTSKGEARERTQIFEGIVLGIRGAGDQKTMTVRKICKGGYGVEKIYPLISPNVQKIELVKTAKVRRAKLTFLRNIGRRFRRKLVETWVK